MSTKIEEPANPIANNIFKIKNLKIGQASDLEGLTGVTVLRFDQGATCAVDVRGAAPGTRETDLLKPENLVDKVHAIVLAGGSAFGLSAMNGAADYLESQGIGWPTEGGIIPIVTGAILYDLTIGDAKARPNAPMGAQAACNATRENLIEGNIGAGTGATVGKAFGNHLATKSGLGIATLSLGKLLVAAVIAVNAFGDVIRQGNIIAGARSNDQSGFISSKTAILSGQITDGLPAQNTTIGAIVTNASLNKSQALKVAQMGHDGYARAINPVHTLFDGDTLFAAATHEIDACETNLIGIMAAEAVEQAIHRAVIMAQSAGGIPAAAELNPQGLSSR